jgi:signal peptidase I
MSEELPTQQQPQLTPSDSVEHPQGRLSGWFRDILETILPALLIVLVVNVFLAQATRVEGQSMEPNLHNNQRLIIEKISYRFRPPRRGDIVVIKMPNRHSDPLIKRVVGLPGETIEVRDGHVYINGQMLNEPYLEQLTYGNTGPHVIAPGSIFVLGDNRGASNDSRSFGEVMISSILGHAWFRYWPLDEIGLVR